MSEQRKPPKLSKLSDDELLSYLAELASELSDVNARAETLYELRNAVYAEARHRQPPITLRKIAAVAGTTDVAVVAALRKLQAS